MKLTHKLLAVGSATVAFAGVGVAAGVMPASAWDGNADVVETCEGWTVNVTDLYSPETAVITHTPAGSGDWTNGNTVQGNTAITWTDSSDTDLDNPWTAKKPNDCESDKKIEICHRDQGNPEWKKIEIAESALQAHLSHQWGEDIYPVPAEGCPKPPVECPDGSEVPYGQECPPPPLEATVTVNSDADCKGDVTGTVSWDGNYPVNEVRVSSGGDFVAIATGQGSSGSVPFSLSGFANGATVNLVGSVNFDVNGEGLEELGFDTATVPGPCPTTPPTEPPVTCPEGSTWNDANDNDVVDDGECVAITTPPTTPTVPPTEPTSPPTQPTTPVVPTNPTVPTTPVVPTNPPAQPTNPTAPPVDDNLPVTGGSSGIITSVVVLLALGGGSLVLIARRRRRPVIG